MSTYPPDSSRKDDVHLREKQYVTLTNGAYVRAAAVTLGVVEIKHVLKSKDGPKLLRDLRLIALGRRDETAPASIRKLKKLRVLDRDGRPLPDLCEVVLAAVKGRYPHFRVEEKPYEPTLENETALAKAERMLVEALGLKSR